MGNGQTGKYTPPFDQKHKQRRYARFVSLYKVFIASNVAYLSIYTVGTQIIQIIIMLYNTLVIINMEI